jgi:hypothetical protein
MAARQQLEQMRGQLGGGGPRGMAEGGAAGERPGSYL